MNPNLLDLPVAVRTAVWRACLRRRSSCQAVGLARVLDSEAVDPVMGYAIIHRTDALWVLQELPGLRAVRLWFMDDDLPDFLLAPRPAGGVLLPATVRELAVMDFAPHNIPRLLSAPQNLRVLRFTQMHRRADAVTTMAALAACSGLDTVSVLFDTGNPGSDVLDLSVFGVCPALRRLHLDIDDIDEELGHERDTPPVTGLHLLTGLAELDVNVERIGGKVDVSCGWLWEALPHLTRLERFELVPSREADRAQVLERIADAVAPGRALRHLRVKPLEYTGDGFEAPPPPPDVEDAAVVTLCARADRGRGGGDRLATLELFGYNLPRAALRHLRGLTCLRVDTVGARERERDGQGEALASLTELSALRALRLDGDHTAAQLGALTALTALRDLREVRLGGGAALPAEAVDALWGAHAPPHLTRLGHLARAEAAAAEAAPEGQGLPPLPPVTLQAGVPPQAFAVPRHVAMRIGVLRDFLEGAAPEQPQTFPLPHVPPAALATVLLCLRQGGASTATVTYDSDGASLRALWLALRTAHELRAEAAESALVEAAAEVLAPRLERQHESLLQPAFGVVSAQGWTDALFKQLRARVRDMVQRHALCGLAVRVEPSRPDWYRAWPAGISGWQWPAELPFDEDEEAAAV